MGGRPSSFVHTDPGDGGDLAVLGTIALFALGGPIRRVRLTT
jgi:hypothetical protein